MEYTAPQITELGSVAEFTRADKFSLDQDGMIIAEIYHQARPNGQTGSPFFSTS